MVWVSCLGLMALLRETGMKDSGEMDTEMVKAFITGGMATYIKENGRTGEGVVRA